MEKVFHRTDSLFSLCGLNCGLCPMQLRGECGGCFHGSTCYQSCPIAPCSVRHGQVEYCFECQQYPCKRYDGIDRRDWLISHLNQKRDLARAKEMGMEAYLEEQREKKRILHRFLEWDDGTRLVFFALAVNLLPLEDVREIEGEFASFLQEPQRDFSGSEGNAKEERASLLEERLREQGRKRRIPLVLRNR